jgi:hypothetical protein
MSGEVRLARWIAGYEVVAGVALVVGGGVTRSWWTAVVGVVFLGLGLATGFGRDEATSWMRGDLDERRQRAVDHSFRVAFLVLAWWVAAVTALASSYDVPVEAWSGGIVVALLAAYVNYARVLRRA